MTIVPLTPDRFDDFARLIAALADYEGLERPIAYAIWFETYSSLLAKPTMFLEDLFVLENARGSGAGGKLFEFVRTLGKERGCGRMDWNVLDWNTPARDFYHRRNAQFMKDWLLYRLVY